MKTWAHITSRWIILLAGLVLASALVGCKNNPESFETSSNTPKPQASTPDITDARRLSNGANKLLDALTKPTNSFHFSYKGQVNINDKYLRDKTQAPQVGPVNVEEDISPAELDLVETRGTTRKESKAKKGDEMKLALANMTLLGLMTNVNFSIAVGSTVSSSPSSDMLGTSLADKYTFDTKQATPSQKMGLDVARGMLAPIQETAGTAWIARDSGELVKFNIDTDYLDKNGHAWKEHYEGEVTPK